MQLNGEFYALGSWQWTRNGGTLKVFSPSPVVLDRTKIHVGRLYIDAPVGRVGWELY
jgi:hypothetical protein